MFFINSILLPKEKFNIFLMRLMPIWSKILFITFMLIYIPEALGAKDYDFIYQNPLPQGNTLNDVWGVSSKSVFAVGEGGTILHYNGYVWTRMESNTSENLNGIWGSSESNVFAVGFTGTLLHYNGNSWQKVLIRFFENMLRK